MIKNLKINSISTAMLLIAIVGLLIRLFSLYILDMRDPSEARYAEMARIMIETNNWIIPYFDYNIPFWGKPPLFIWLSAISFKLFGVNEFAGKFPHWVCNIITLYIIWKLTFFQISKVAANIAVAVLSTSIMFILLSGALLADPVMLVGISLTQAGFWIGFNSKNKREAKVWQYLFFIGVAISFLAKSIAAFVLSGLPIFFWCLINKQFFQFWKKFPWFFGTILSSIISLPWFIIAEIKNPGLLNYMIIGENFSRYLQSGWTGDKYGHAHIKTIGTIWCYFFFGGLPWSVFLIFSFLKCLWLKFFKKNSILFNNWDKFVICWIVSILLFFTFARNIIWTYSLSTMPALSLAVTTIIINKLKTIKLSWLIPTTLVAPLIITVLLVLTVEKKIEQPTQKYIISTIKNLNSYKSNDQIYYYLHRPFSARYYSEGKARLINSKEGFLDILNIKKNIFIITDQKDEQDLIYLFNKKKYIPIYTYSVWTVWVKNN